MSNQIAFSEILKFEELFHCRTYNMLVYEDSLLEENLNQNDDEKLEEINEIDYELREISKAADLVNICDIFDLEESTNNHDKEGVLLSGKLDILLLVSQHQKHEAHSKDEKFGIQQVIEINSTLNLNPNKVNIITRNLEF
ncbi:unnamed protein product [Rhizophagus irregularis]|nr:unnamed protein product [Rhizophagus irregularis]CAB5350509.1 unnamed protein product [Rhizophagus irregularis]